MGINNIQSRLNKIETITTQKYSNKWRLNKLYIFYMGNDDDINNNKKYHFTYKGKKLIYDNMEDFYNDYNVYPKKDINPIIDEVVDNSYLKKVLYETNKKEV